MYEICFKTCPAVRYIFQVRTLEFFPSHIWRGTASKDVQFIATFLEYLLSMIRNLSHFLNLQGLLGCVTCDFHPSGKSKVRNAGSRKRSPSYVHCASSNPAIGLERDICSPQERGESCIRYKKGWEQNTDITKTGRKKEDIPQKIAWQLCDLALFLLMLF